MRKKSISDEFGIPQNYIGLLASPGKQLNKNGVEELGENLVKNPRFEDATMVGHVDNRYGNTFIDEPDREFFINSENQNFEGGTVGNWVGRYNGIVEISTDFVHSGTYSLKVTSTDNTVSAYLDDDHLTYQHGLPHPQMYEISYWAYIPSASTCNMVKAYIGGF